MTEVKLTIFNSLTGKVDKYYKTLFKDRMTDRREEVDEMDVVILPELTTICVHAHNQSIGEYHRYRNAQ